MQRNSILGAGVLMALGIVAFLAIRINAPADSDANRAPHVAGSVTPSSKAIATMTPFDRRALRAEFVGSAACTPCHQAQAAAFTKSHHARALALPASDAVVAHLDGQVFSTPLGGTTRFARNQGVPEVTSRDAAGGTRTLVIAYVAGVFPLRQFVVRTERGKLQTLGVSWDARPAKDGGQRFFHVYGPRGVAPDDALFFTTPAQNWNHVCADCHSTFVERRYDLGADRFDTRFAELAVGCESCHGPGARHVRAARTAEKGDPAYASPLGVRLRPSAPWSPSASGSPSPRAPDDTELEVCAPCHSRRRSIHEGFIAGDRLLDAFEPELLRAGGYYADGQVEGEVYEWGSFMQSKMHASGVRCSDCHEPHSAELRAPENALCAGCHAPGRFATASHTHHAGSEAPSCVDCHMPPSTFMQVDQRRDHSLHVPRPDLSVAFGVPNACNACHAKETPGWALEALTKWRPASSPRAHFGEALGRARRGALDAPRALNALARDATAPVIARATALEELARFPNKTSIETVRAALVSPEPLIVYGAVLGASAWPLELRAELLALVVEHPRRAVRIAAAKALAELRLEKTDRKTFAALERAFAEVEESFAVSASRPETHVERSAFEVSRGRLEEAVRALETALRLSPCLAEARLNLADIARIRRDEATAEREIRAAIACAPENAHAHHALGLWLVRTGKKHEAIASLRKASKLAPADARMSYVLAVAVAEEGDVREATKILEAALEKNENDRDLLQALAGYLLKLGQTERASDVKAKIEALSGE